MDMAIIDARLTDKFRLSTRTGSESGVCAVSPSTESIMANMSVPSASWKCMGAMKLVGWLESGAAGLLVVVDVLARLCIASASVVKASPIPLMLKVKASSLLFEPTGMSKAVF